MGRPKEKLPRPRSFSSPRAGSSRSRRGPLASSSGEESKLGEPLAGAAEVCLDDFDIDVEEPLGDLPPPPVDWPLSGGAALIDSPVPRSLQDFDATDALPVMSLPVDEDISDLPTGVRPMPRPPGDIGDLPTGVRSRPAAPEPLSGATDVLPALEPGSSVDEDISDLPTGVRPMPSPPGRAGEQVTTRMRAPRPRKG